LGFLQNGWPDKLHVHCADVSSPLLILKAFSTKGRRAIAGSTAIVALIIVSVGTIGLMSLMGIINARTQQVEASETSFLRRIRELNGRQLAKEYIYRNVLPNATGAGETIEWSYDDGDSDPSDDNWARIVVGSWSGSPYSTTTLGVSNPTSPGGDLNPYEVPVTVSVLGNVTSTGTWDTAKVPYEFRYRACGMNPALAGILFGLHRSLGGTESNEASGSILVNGGSYLYKPTLGPDYSFSTERMRGSNVDLTGSGFAVTEIDSTDPVAVSNVPFVPMIVSFPDFSVLNNGSLDIVWGTWGTGPISLQTAATNGGGMLVDPLTPSSTNGVTSDGAGNITIDLDDPSLPHVLISDEALSITLQGQTTAAEEIAAATMSPVIIAAKDSAGGINDIGQITATGNNTRGLILGIGRDLSAPLQMDFLSVNFRMIYIAQQAPTTVTTGGAAVNLEGGIFTNCDFIHSGGGSLNIVRDDDPAALSSIAPRWVWVEGYLNP
jgi:hypothetical protein